MLTKPRTILILVGIFLAGGVSGVFLAPLFHSHERTRSPLRHTFAERHMGRLEKVLELTPEQRAQVEVLVQRTGEEMAKLRRDSLRDGFQRMKALNDKIAALLTPEQRVKFENFQREQMERLRRNQLERDQRHSRRRGEPAADDDRAPPPADEQGATPPAPGP